MKNIFLFVSLFGFATTQASDSLKATTAELVFRLRKPSGTDFRSIVASPTPSSTPSTPSSFTTGAESPSKIFSQEEKDAADLLARQTHKAWLALRKERK